MDKYQIAGITILLIMGFSFYATYISKKFDSKEVLCAVLIFLPIVLLGVSLLIWGSL